MELSNKELEEYNRLNTSEIKKPEDKDGFNMKENMSYIIIVLLAVMSIVVSCLSTVDGDLSLVFPTTVIGWVLLVGSKVVTSILGYMIWTEFFNKGKHNATKTEEYKKAQNIYNEIQGKSDKNLIDVVNPRVWEKKMKVKKGIKVVLTLLLTTFLVASLVVSFSVASLVASLLSLVVSVFFGLQMMTNAEEMFSIGNLQYALLLKVQYENSKLTQSDTSSEELTNVSTEENKEKDTNE